MLFLECKSNCLQDCEYYLSDYAPMQHGDVVLDVFGFRSVVYPSTQSVWLCKMLLPLYMQILGQLGGVVSTRHMYSKHSTSDIFFRSTIG